MRSTKDLKDIVSGVRAKSKMNGISGPDFEATSQATTKEIDEQVLKNKKFSTFDTFIKKENQKENENK